MSAITNIAAYRFAALSELKDLRVRLVEQCRAWGLKGTILLSPEGINLFVAGGAAEIDLLLGTARDSGAGGVTAQDQCERSPAV